MKKSIYYIVGSFIITMDKLNITREPCRHSPGVDFDHELLIEYWRKGEYDEDV